MRNVFDSLSEKDRRRYAAVEADRLGRGQRYISRLLGCTERAIRRGLWELDQLPNDPLSDRQRAQGGGRKPKLSLKSKISSIKSSTFTPSEVLTNPTLSGPICRFKASPMNSKI